MTPTDIFKKAVIPLMNLDTFTSLSRPRTNVSVSTEESDDR
ncbi:hypothetical protein SynBIOSE41_02424 [Synechococcus sp. BIOS-E4-1]|nr:hypothetical protein SynBIOSE41_02424 [Synechococcus sp. BIOS-E4-1]